MIVLPHFTRSLLARAVLAWLFVRVAVSAGKAAAEAMLELPPSHPLELTLPAAQLVVGIVVLAVSVDVRRRNEDLFLLCLGYDRARLAGTLLLPALALEVIAAAVVRA